MRLMSFSSHFFVVFVDQATKILHNNLFTLFTEQGKTGKNGIENLATYFWYFGSFDEMNLPKYVMSRALLATIFCKLNVSSDPNRLHVLVS